MDESNVGCDLCGSKDGEPIVEKFDIHYLQCRECGLVYSDTNGFDFAAHNQQIIADLSSMHDAKHDSRRHARAYEALLRNFAQYRDTNRIVEIGCSSGAFLRKAAIAGWQGVGVEPVAESATTGIREYGLDIRIGTLEQAELDSGCADVVYSKAVLEHLESPLAVTREAARILRRGGLFYADTVNLASYTWRFLGSRWKLVDPRMHLHLFSPDSLSRLCEQAGLRVERISTHGVRFHASRDDQPRGVRRIVDELHKAPYSIAAKRNLMGDSIAIYARKQ